MKKFIILIVGLTLLAGPNISAAPFQTDTIASFDTIASVDTSEYQTAELSISDTTGKKDTLYKEEPSGESVTVSKDVSEKVNYAMYILMGIVTFGGLIKGLFKNVKYLSTTIPILITDLTILYNQAVDAGGLQNITANDLLTTAAIAVLGIYLPGIEWGSVFPKLWSIILGIIKPTAIKKS